MKKMRLMAAGMLLAASTTTAWAQAVKSDSGVFIGAEGGIAGYRFSADEDLKGWSESKNAGALRALIGYRFNPNFSVELSYLSLGDYKLESPRIAGNRQAVRANVDAFDVSVIYKFTQFVPGVYLKAGLMNSTVSVEARESYERNASHVESHTKSGNGYSLGLGYEYDLTPHLSANAGFTRLQRMGGSWEDNVKINANLYSAGLKYRF